MKIENLIELLNNRIKHLEKLKELSIQIGDISNLSSIELETESVLNTIQQLKSIGQ